jgi:hypothetical protein
MVEDVEPLWFEFCSVLTSEHEDLVSYAVDVIQSEVEFLGSLLSLKNIIAL